VVDDTGLEPV